MLQSHPLKNPRLRVLPSATEALLVSVLLLVLCVLPANAAFTGPYALDNFTLTNNNGNGTWSTPDNGLTLLLTGSFNGTGLEGWTYFTMPAPEATQVSFDWQLTTDDDPSFRSDVGGYWLGSTFFPLADYPGTGAASFSVNLGEDFGFAVYTQDNWGGAATLAVTNFQTGVSDVPEPSFTLPLLAALGGFSARSVCMRMRRRRSQQ